MRKFLHHDFLGVFIRARELENVVGNIVGNRGGKYDK
jgi:hypothetical protein